MYGSPHPAHDSPYFKPHTQEHGHPDVYSPPTHDEDDHSVGGDGYTDFFDLNHPPAAYMPPSGFNKKPLKYKPPTSPKKKKKKNRNKNKKPDAGEYLKPSEVPDYDDYFEPYAQPQEPYKPTKSPAAAKKPYHNPPLPPNAVPRPAVPAVPVFENPFAAGHSGDFPGFPSFNIADGENHDRGS